MADVEKHGWLPVSLNTGSSLAIFETTAAEKSTVDLGNTNRLLAMYISLPNVSAGSSSLFLFTLSTTGAPKPFLEAILINAHLTPNQNSSTLYPHPLLIQIHTPDFQILSF